MLKIFLTRIVVGDFFILFRKTYMSSAIPSLFFCRRIILTLIPIFNTDVWGEKNAEKVSHATPLLHYKSLLRSMYLLCCCCSLGNEAVHTEMENFEEKIHKFCSSMCAQEAEPSSPSIAKKSLPHGHRSVRRVSALAMIFYCLVGGNQ